MMDGMMGCGFGGWLGMAIASVFGILLFTLLVLAILALGRYVFTSFRGRSGDDAAG